ncbi:MAG: metallophosphatase family protein, partial [Bacilli bacterium]|nr:metallophosphatase family protein [Bacilli bacterium]
MKRGNNMKYAVISDIHGNSEALKATIASAIENKCTGFVFLGDYGTDFPGIHEVLAMVRWCQQNYPTYVIKGNREEYILEYLNGSHPDWENNPTKKIIMSDIVSLSEEDKEFIRSLSSAAIVNLPNIGKVAISHSINLNAEIKEAINTGEIKTVLFGHSHTAGTWHSGSCDYYNPGSVGLSKDGTTSTYAILEQRENKIYFDIKVVNYDIEKENELIDSKPELSGPSAAYIAELTKMSMAVGRPMSIYFFGELHRLNAIYKKAQETNSEPDYSPLDESIEKTYILLSGISIDSNNNIMPSIDIDIRQTYPFSNNKMDINNLRDYHVDYLEFNYDSVPNELIPIAF